MADPTENKHEERPRTELTKEERKAVADPAEPADDEAAADEKEELEAAEPTEPVRTRHSAASPGTAVRWLAAAALLVALGALGTALWVLLRGPLTTSSTSTSSSTTTTAAPSAQQIADAKAKACSAYVTVRTAVTLRSNANPGPDPGGALAAAVSANARLALAAGNSYLMANLDPATPAPLADAIRKFAARFGRDRDQRAGRGEQ